MIDMDEEKNMIGLLSMIIATVDEEDYDEEDEEDDYHEEEKEDVADSVNL